MASSSAAPARAPREKALRWITCSLCTAQPGSVEFSASCGTGARSTAGVSGAREDERPTSVATRPGPPWRGPSWAGPVQRCVGCPFRQPLRAVPAARCALLYVALSILQAPHLQDATDGGPSRQVRTPWGAGDPGGACPCGGGPAAAPGRASLQTLLARPSIAPHRTGLAGPGPGSARA